MWLVTYFLTTITHKITEAESIKNVLVKTVCTNYAQQYAISQDGGHFQHDNHFLDSFLQACVILLILLSYHTFLTMQNLNFDLRNSVKAYFTTYETKS